jgi:ABC-type lipoprotein export system ATPase subunit
MGEFSMPDALVEFASVSRSFSVGGADIPAVNDVSCWVMPCDRIAIVGPSGSGKSTLMALMAGLDFPTAGAVTWPGFPQGEHLRPRYIGLAFQAPSLMPALTALENVEVPLLILGEEGDTRAKAYAALESFELAHLADRLPEELSGGQAQRIAAVRAVVTAPRLILADEPTGQLDQAAGRQVIQKLIEQAEKTGAALVIATHDQAVARQMNETWRMRHGCLEIAKSLRAAS